jgi:hypothetical protein
MLMDLEYQDTILSTLIAKCEEKWEFSTEHVIFNTIYACTPVHSPARKLLVDFFCYAGGANFVDDRNIAQDYPADFVNSVLRDLLDKREVPDGLRPWVASLESYIVGTRQKK